MKIGLSQRSRNDDLLQFSDFLAQLFHLVVLCCHLVPENEIMIRMEDDGDQMEKMMVTRGQKMDIPPKQKEKVIIVGPVRETIFDRRLKTCLNLSISS